MHVASNILAMMWRFGCDGNACDCNLYMYIHVYPAHRLIGGVPLHTWPHLTGSCLLCSRWLHSLAGLCGSHGQPAAPPRVITDLVVPDRWVNIHASDSFFQAPTKHRGGTAPVSMCIDSDGRVAGLMFADLVSMRAWMENDRTRSRTWVVAATIRHPNP